MSVFTTRPVIMGTKSVVTAGHYLGAVAGLRMFEKGGNAIDAAAAVGFSLAVLEPHMNSLGGEVPILVYSPEEGRVVALSGQGPAPMGLNIDWFKSRGVELIPGDGFLPAVVPSVVGTWIEALKRFGKLSLREVITPAIELAEDGFALQFALRELIAANAQRFRTEWKTTARTFLPNDRLPDEGEILRQPELATTMRSLVEAEKKAPRGNRSEGLEAARREFYEGGLTKKLLGFLEKNESTDATGRSHKSFLTGEDFAKYRARIVEPVSTEYRGFEVFKCGPWTQGPVFLQQLNILEGFDLRAIGHNSADYIHVLVEAAKLAYADRETYYGDPDFDEVPLKVLLSKEYASSRRARIDMKHASMEVPAGTIQQVHTGSARGRSSGDTTHLDAIDKWGNMVAATQSGGWINSSPLIDGLGFALSTRAQMFFLDSRRNGALSPGKRPRTTLTPSLAFKDGKPLMVFGTPGGDQQDQWSLQFFLNFADFEMNLQLALDAPSFHTFHFPSSFYPKAAEPGKVVVEGRIPNEVREELRRRGHMVEVAGDWENGRVLAVKKDLKSGVIFGAASPKMIYGNTGYAVGW